MASTVRQRLVINELTMPAPPPCSALRERSTPTIAGALAALDG
jgi:hypothetical protein